MPSITYPSPTYNPTVFRPAVSTITVGLVTGGGGTIDLVGASDSVAEHVGSLDVVTPVSSPLPPVNRYLRQLVS